jgi:hypothetical protein
MSDASANPNDPQLTLTVAEGYQAMWEFIDQYNARGGSEVLALMLFDMRSGAPGVTNDLALWHDWLDCVHKVKSGDQR